MLKPEELRLKNLVQDEDGTIGTVCRIEKNSIEILHDEGYSIITDPFKHLNPIPLTEEWLVKFGLNKHEKHSSRMAYLNGFYDFTTDTYLFNMQDGTTTISTIEYNHEIETEIAIIKHVHQLQNLYFALTGKELTE